MTELVVDRYVGRWMGKGVNMVTHSYELSTLGAEAGGS